MTRQPHHRGCWVCRDPSALLPRAAALAHSPWRAPSPGLRGFPGLYRACGRALLRPARTKPAWRSTAWAPGSTESGASRRGREMRSLCTRCVWTTAGASWRTGGCGRAGRRRLAGAAPSVGVHPHALPTRSSGAHTPGMHALTSLRPELCLQALPCRPRRLCMPAELPRTSSPSPTSVALLLDGCGRAWLHRTGLGVITTVRT